MAAMRAKKLNSRLLDADKSEGAMTPPEHH
jgi:hypothetical protein